MSVLGMGERSTVENHCPWLKPKLAVKVHISAGLWLEPVVGSDVDFHCWFLEDSQSFSDFKAQNVPAAKSHHCRFNRNRR
jgi:hypothetical protein